MDKLSVKSVVKLFAQVADININNIRSALIVKVPYMIFNFFAA